MSDLNPLYSEDAERALIGSVLVSPSLFNDVAGIVSFGSFHLETHRWIWKAICEVKSAHEAIDSVTITAQLRRSGKLDDVGGLGYIQKLVSLAPYTFDAESYAKEVADYARRREMTSIASMMATAAHKLDGDIDAAQADVYQRLQNLHSGIGGSEPVSSWLSAAYDYIEKAANGQAPEGLQTGFADIDRVLGGLYPSDGTMMILAGEPGAGKTIMLQDFATNFQKQMPGVFYSLEMKKRRMALRLLSSATGLSVRDMKHGRVEGDDWTKLAEGVAHIEKYNMHVSDRPNWTTTQLRADLAKLKHEKGIKWFCLDYLGQLKDEMPGAKKWERIGELSNRLLTINRELELSSVVIHTLTKSGEYTGDKGLEYDVDAAAILRKPTDAEGLEMGSDTKFDRVILDWTKLRDGENGLGTIKLLKHKDRPKFESAYEDWKLSQATQHPAGAGGAR